MPTKQVAVLTRRQVSTLLVGMMGWEHIDVKAFWDCAARLGLRVEPVEGELRGVAYCARKGTTHFMLPKGAAPLPTRAKPFKRGK